MGRGGGRGRRHRGRRPGLLHRSRPRRAGAHGRHVRAVLALDGRLHRDARPLAAYRQADDRADQWRLRRRRKRAPDGVRPVGDRRRRLHPPRRPGARIGARRRGDPVAPAHRGRSARARDHHAVRAGEPCPGARVGARLARRASWGARRHRGGAGREARPQAARGDALHEDAAQLVARPGVVTDRPARARLAGDPLHRRRDARGRRRLPRQAAPALRRAAASRGRRGTGVPSCAAPPACRRATSSAALCGTGLPDAWEAVP